MDSWVSLQGVKLIDSPDEVVLNTRQVLDSSTPNQYNGKFLKAVTSARYVGNNRAASAREDNLGYLPDSRVWLLRLN
jgi:hypothetical protein